ncbi:MAG: hypothetical protein ACT4OX_11075 [Actinomycetota bacterium]
MRRRGHPVWAAFSGFFLGLFVGLDLLLLGVVPLNSIVLTVLPVVGLVLGIIVALLVPLKRKPHAEAPGGAAVSMAAPAPDTAVPPLDTYVPPPPPPTAVPSPDPDESSEP